MNPTVKSQFYYNILTWCLKHRKGETKRISRQRAFQRHSVTAAKDPSLVGTCFTFLGWRGEERPPNVPQWKMWININLNHMKLLYRELDHWLILSVAVGSPPSNRSGSFASSYNLGLWNGWGLNLEPYPYKEGALSLNLQCGGWV